VGAILTTLLLILTGAGVIVAGVKVTFGTGPALICLGICCLIAAFITARGAANA
jgi:hypothetical protein